MEPKPTRTMPKWLLALIQAFLVGVFVFAAFLSTYEFQSKFAIASLAASAFIAFGFPTAKSARARHLIGGYVCGTVCGAACCLLRRLLPAQTADSAIVLICFSALSVFLTAFFMILFNVQHPPACALAAAMVLEKEPIGMGLAMLACIVVLCAMKWLAERWIGPYLPKPGGSG